MEILSEYGYWGLFLSSFLAATLLPFSSEVILGLVLMQGLDPCFSLAAATSGNVLGAVMNYGIGLFGSRWILHKFWRMSDADIRKATKRFEKLGIFSLLLAWVPLIGDPLTVAAGILKINFALFFMLVGLGKFLRYLIISWAVLSV